MIFTFGSIGFIIGWLLINVMGSRFDNNWADYVGVTFCLLGIVGMITSVLVLVWQHLP